MTKFRLSPTDLANIATLPTERKRSALEAIDPPRVIWGYQPVREALPKLLLATSPLFGDLERGDDDKVIQQIGRASRSSAEQEEANIAVAKAIISWRDHVSARGVVVNPEPFRTTAATIRYCADVAPIINENIYVISLDCRSSMNMTGAGREFMKALIHHTALIGNLSSAEVAILSTPAITKGVRKAVFEPLDGDPLYTLDELQEMIIETYAILELVQRARRSDGSDGAASEGGLF